jgi:hypothetical protein
LHSPHQIVGRKTNGGIVGGAFVTANQIGSRVGVTVSSGTLAMFKINFTAGNFHFS